MNDKNLKLKAARAEMDLSQEQLAGIVDVSRQTINLIETGKYNPTLDLCIRICWALNKTLNDIFWKEKENK
ncbi:helix-turn-helix transcriptional regulator [Clostridium sp.]|jgi:putative transcriptional regulator|uniref:helix-turn-helix transcriptional regulator n=1 Tax=Clostridium sp. TaxID=1506 RepID=UPI00258BEFC2|nr:helix-turn-helix transcriptional regulator [Clostridium sp.]MDF2505919.1 Cro/Cl family transcriptional regulator [Clostridium sp.]